MFRFKGGSCRLYIGTTAVCLLLLMPGYVQAAGQDMECEEALSEAEELYFDGDFAGALGVLSNCYFRDDLSPELSIEIARLVSLAYINQDNLDAARRAVLRILSLDADYEADPVQDPPSYASMVSIVRRQVRAGELEVPEAAEVRRSHDWLYVVGGGVITVAITTVIAVMADRNSDSGIQAHDWPSR